MIFVSGNKRVLLTVSDLTVEFPFGKKQKIQAVSGVSFHIDRGETLGLVGESGCGKSTLARTIVRLEKPTRGEIRFDGQVLSRSHGHRLRELRPGLQMIFQDAMASLNPGRCVGKSIAEPLRVIGGYNRNTCVDHVRKLMGQVGLDPDKDAGKYPHEFSGGQCQRISIARALITRPKLLVCDEPVSSLDVSVQAQILNLLERMRKRYALTRLFISHDLAVVKNVSDRVAVMYLGKICEIAATEDIYRSPHHPYTALLMASIPKPVPEIRTVRASATYQEMPSPADPPPGCRFHTRCPQAQAVCLKIEPELIDVKGGRQVACHFPLPMRV